MVTYPGPSLIATTKASMPWVSSPVPSRSSDVEVRSIRMNSPTRLAYCNAEIGMNRSTGSSSGSPRTCALATAGKGWVSSLAWDTMSSECVEVRGRSQGGHSILVLVLRPVVQRTSRSGYEIILDIDLDG